MKLKYLKYIIIILFSVISGAVGYHLIIGESYSTEHAHDSEEQLYTCGMHPTIIEKEPGTCPLCGMNLTPIKDSKKTEKIIYWRAPMDPNEIYNEPGKSKMGMELVPVFDNEESSSGVVTVDGSVLQSMNVKTETVQTKNIHNTVTTNGILDTDETKEFLVTTKISGWIEKLFALVYSVLRVSLTLIKLGRRRSMTSQFKLLSSDDVIAYIAYIISYIVLL